MQKEVISKIVRDVLREKGLLNRPTEKPVSNRIQRARPTPAVLNVFHPGVRKLEQALESARLYQDTQRHAAEEQLLGEVTARMRETLSLDTVLRTAIHEMGSALGLPKVEVRMVSKPPGPNNGNGLKRKHSDGPGPGATNGRSSKETTDAG